MLWSIRESSLSLTHCSLLQRQDQRFAQPCSTIRPGYALIQRLSNMQNLMAQIGALLQEKIHVNPRARPFILVWFRFQGLGLHLASMRPDAKKRASFTAVLDCLICVLSPARPCLLPEVQSPNSPNLQPV